MVALILRFKIVVFLFLTSTLMIFLPGCSDTTNPKKAVSAFFDSCKNKDLNTAMEFIKPSESKRTGLEFTDKGTEQIFTLEFSKLTYEIESCKAKGNSATVKVKVVSIDLLAITDKLNGELLPALKSAQAGGLQLDEAELKKVVEQYYIENINSPFAPKLTTEVTIALVKSEDKKAWLISPNDNLINAMSGNFLNKPSTMKVSKKT